jgi:hypothetical protein
MTTYYTYLKPDGTADVTSYRLPSTAHGYVLVGESSVRPNLDGMKWYEGAWVPIDPAYETNKNRRASYPPLGDQLDALWHAMDDGILPKVEPFYSDIKAVKDHFPKPSN